MCAGCCSLSLVPDLRRLIGQVDILRKRVRSCSSSSLDWIAISMPVSPGRGGKADCSSWQGFGAARSFQVRGSKPVARRTCAKTPFSATLQKPAYLLGERPERFELPTFWFVGRFCARQQTTPAYRNQQNQRRTRFPFGWFRLLLYTVH